MPLRIQRFGWIPDLPDQRDHLYAAPLVAIGPLPPSIDLSGQCPDVYDQGHLGSCTANAIAGAIEFDQRKQGLPEVFTPSRLFIYYNEREIEGTVDTDSGAQIRDGMKSVSHCGACHEALWKYDIAQFQTKPPQPCYDDAGKHKVVLYQRLTQNLGQMKGCLASGFPFVFGFAVYESFESEQVARTGEVPMPASSEDMLGGHAVLAVGYDDAQQRFLVRNSWGSGWGKQGYFTMPYAYLIDRGLASDFWTARLVQ